MDDAAGWIDFVKAAFGAEELSRSEAEGGIMHAHLRIGDSMIEVSDSNERWPAVRSALHLYVEDAA